MKKKRKKTILNYHPRTITLFILFILFVILSFLFLQKSIIIQEKENIYYEETGTPDYKVFLKDNIYYKEKYLDKNMSYIANLIDYISIDFNYKFKSDTKLSGEYYYKIIADLEIINPNNKKLFYSKQYDLLEENKYVLNNESEYIIKENVNIDYDYYNSLADSFKSSYGVDTESNLKVYLELHRRIDENSVNNKGINADNKIDLVIPLSEKAINIEMDTMEIKKQNTIVSSNNYKVEDIKCLIFGLVYLIIALLIFIKIYIKLTKNQDKLNTYDITLRKILRQYDRLIVNVDTMPDFENSTTIKANNFDELLDAKDNIHRPIFYYEVIPHKKSYFYIKYDNEYIIYTLKDVTKDN